MPPPFSTGLVLCRITHADLATSVIITLVSYFGGLFLSPLLLYLVVSISIDIKIFLKNSKLTEVFWQLPNPIIIMPHLISFKITFNTDKTI